VFIDRGHDGAGGTSRPNQPLWPQSWTNTNGDRRSSSSLSVSLLLFSSLTLLSLPIPPLLTSASVLQGYCKQGTSFCCTLNVPNVPSVGTTCVFDAGEGEESTLGSCEGIDEGKSVCCFTVSLSFLLVPCWNGFEVERRRCG